MACAIYGNFFIPYLQHIPLRTFYSTPRNRIAVHNRRLRRRGKRFFRPRIVCNVGIIPALAHSRNRECMFTLSVSFDIIFGAV